MKERNLNMDTNYLRKLAGLPVQLNESHFDKQLEEPNEGNEFSGELVKARRAGQDEFEVDGKTYPVKEDEMVAERQALIWYDLSVLGDDQDLFAELDELIDQDGGAERVVHPAHAEVGSSDSYRSDNEIGVPLNYRRTLDFLDTVGATVVSENVNEDELRRMAKLAGVELTDQQIAEWANSPGNNYEDRGHYQEQPEGETVDLSLRRYLNADPEAVKIEESHTEAKMMEAYKKFKIK